MTQTVEPEAPGSAGAGPAAARRSVVVVGSGLRFLSGISVYTHELAHELSARHDVGVVLMRQLVPTRLYPGGARVGAELSSLDYADFERAEVDWHWVGTLQRAVRLLRRRRPQALVLQWWTAATAHTYVALALAAKALGVRVLIEFHEVQDPGERTVRGVAGYGHVAIATLARLADGFLVHHAADLAALSTVLDGSDKPIELEPHPPYSYLSAVEPSSPPELLGLEPADCTFTLFGIMRPRKGLEVALDAFRALPRDVAERSRLLLVGEGWEGFDEILARAKQGPHGDRIVVVDRYVSDAEAAAVFDATDVVLLPYLESSSSGPLAIAAALGLPFLFSDLPGLHAAAASAPTVARSVTVGDGPAWAAALEAAVGDWSRGSYEPQPLVDGWAPMLAAYDRLLTRTVPTA